MKSFFKKMFRKKPDFSSGPLPILLRRTSSIVVYITSSGIPLTTASAISLQLLKPKDPCFLYLLKNCMA